MNARNNYNLISQAFTKHHYLREAANVLKWDQLTKLPSNGVASQSRSRAISGLQDQMQRVLMTKDVLFWVTNLYHDQYGLSPPELANFFEMVSYMKIRRTPIDQRQEREVKRKKMDAAGVASGHQQRLIDLAATDPSAAWAEAVPLLQSVVDTSREQGAFLKSICEDPTVNNPYDMMLEDHERGLRTVDLDSHYHGLKEWLPKLMVQQAERTKDEAIVLPEDCEGTRAHAWVHDGDQSGVPSETYLALARDVFELFGADTSRLMLSTGNLSCTSTASSVTRVVFSAQPFNILGTVNSIFHEAGHAKYEQGLPAALRTQPAGWARSVAVHESQSGFVEMFILRNTAFAPALGKLLTKHFGENPAFEPENLCRIWRKPGNIEDHRLAEVLPPALARRVNGGARRMVPTDMCQCLQHLVYYELERDLMAGSLTIADVPAAMAEKVEACGLPAAREGDHRVKVLRLSLWFQGTFGYLPVYTNGLLYAAQFWASMKGDLGSGELHDKIAQGDFKDVFAWLERCVWRHGSILSTDDLLYGASGTRLNPRFYQDWLVDRFQPPKAQ